jgi:hypothetical protein
VKGQWFLTRFIYATHATRQLNDMSDRMGLVGGATLLKKLGMTNV